MGYGATDEPEAEEMHGMTDDEADVKSRKKKGKSGMKPGQALSFSGLEKRSHTGGDMLDMQVVRCAPVLLAPCHFLKATGLHTPNFSALPPSGLPLSENATRLARSTVSRWQLLALATPARCPRTRPHAHLYQSQRAIVCAARHNQIALFHTTPLPC